MRKPAAPKSPRLNLKRTDIRLKRLSTDGWYKELTKIYKLSVFHKLDLHKRHPTIHHIQNGRKTDIGQVLWPAVELVGARRGGVVLEQDRLPALIINLDAPDAVIFTEFKRVLREVRRYWNPVASPGQYNFKGRFDGRTFARWIHNKIVPLAYLLVWKAQLSPQDKKVFSNEALGDYLWKNDPDAEKKFYRAKVILKKALETLPGLAMQLQHEAVAKQNPSHVAAWIAKQL